MAPVPTIRLFEAEPDLLRFVAREDRDEASKTELPVRALPNGDVDVREILLRAGSFGAVLLDGMLLQSVRLGERSGLRLLGPGDLLALSGSPPPMIEVDASCRATVVTHVVLLGRALLLASRRWPLIVAGLHSRAGEQSDRIVTQLMICQLPRVDDRLLAMFWLLAESWGRVTPSGTMLPVVLTHDALGGLIGARRPTVTLALGELADRGAILRREEGWLLLHRPSLPAPGLVDAVEAPAPSGPLSSTWTANVAELAPDGATHALLRETVARLEAQHVRARGQHREGLERAAATRAQIAERRRLLS